MVDPSQRAVTVAVQGPAAEEWLKQHGPAGAPSRYVGPPTAPLVLWGNAIAVWRIPLLDVGVEWDAPSAALAEAALDYFRSQVVDGDNLLRAHQALLRIDVEQG